MNETTIKEWQKTKLKQILEKYEPSDNYNTDETELFWQMPPENLLGFVGKKTYSSKQLKTSIMLFVSANMSGTDKLLLLAIG